MQNTQDSAAISHYRFPPAYWVPTSYLAEGIPNALVMTVSLIIYKNLGLDNDTIAFWTSWLYLPWVVKPFWSPMIDMFSTKRRWMVITQWMMAISLGLVAWQVISPMFFITTMLIWYAMAFTSATHDIACDGFYLVALTPSEQSLFAGIRSTFFRVALIIGTGAIPYLAGTMIKVATTFRETGTLADNWLGHFMAGNSSLARWLSDRLLYSPNHIAQSWAIALGVIALLFGLIALWHTCILPHPSEDRAVSKKRTAKAKEQASTPAQPDSEEESASFFQIFISFFHQKEILCILAFLLLYRLGEAQLVRLATPFMLDARDVGGLALTTDQVGLIYGTCGVVGLLLGGILSGVLVSIHGLKRLIWWMAFAINAPDLFYVYLSYYQPPDLWTIGSLVVLEQFGYGFGFTGYMIFMMFCAKGKYKTAHYAIATGFMALGMMLPGMFSGWIQQMVGYPYFFTWVCLCTVPGFFTLLLIPLDAEWGKK